NCWINSALVQFFEVDNNVVLCVGLQEFQSTLIQCSGSSFAHDQNHWQLFVGCFVRAMEVFTSVQANCMFPLHLHEMEAAHGISNTIVWTGCQYIEHCLILIFFSPSLRLCKTVFLAFLYNLVDI